MPEKATLIHIDDVWTLLSFENQILKNKYMSEMEELEADILKLEKEFQQSKFKEVHQLLVHKKLRYNKLHT